MHLVYTPDVRNCVNHFVLDPSDNGAWLVIGQEIGFNRISLLACLPL